MGGYEIGAHALIRELEKRGHYARVLTCRPVESVDYIVTRNSVRDVARIFSPIYRLYREIPGLVRDPQRYLADRHEGFAGYRLENISLLREQINSFGPDIIYFFNPLGLGTLGLLEYCQDRKIPHLIHSMDHLTEYLLENAEKIGLKNNMQRALVSLPWIYCSRNVAQDYAFTRIIPNTPAPAFWKHRAPLAKDFKTIRAVYWGRICADKGFSTMVEIAQRLENEEWFGGIDLIGTLEGVEIPPGLKKLRHLPPIDIARNISRLRRRYNVGLFPLSGREPFGYVAPESILMGLTTIVSANVGSAENYVQPGGVLSVRDQTDVEGFIEALRATHRGHTRAEALAMRRQMEERLAPGRVITQINDFIDYVIDRAAPQIRLTLEFCRRTGR